MTAFHVDLDEVDVVLDRMTSTHADLSALATRLDAEGRTLLQQARSRFLKELSALLESHPGEWVAYRGETRLGFAKTKRAESTGMYSVRRRARRRRKYVPFDVEPS